jgi:hypothetical protein
MSALLLVRAMQDLRRACREASGLLAIQHRSRRRGASDVALLGIWIEARMAQEFPVALTGRDPTGAGRRFAVRESAGVPNVWTLLWLDVPDGTDRDDARHVILQALLEDPAYNGVAGDSGWFVPVFAANTAAETVQAEMQCLRERFPVRLGLFVFQDPATQRLSPCLGSEADE